MSKVVITYGTFDLFHIGHVRLLKRLKSLGDKLIVGVSSDEFNEVKGKCSYYSYNERVEILKSCVYVDEVIEEASWDQKVKDIKKYNVAIFAIGDDWNGEFDYLSDYCQVKYLKRTKDISTTQIKRQLSSVNDNELEELENKLHETIELVKCLSKISR
ncbi:glycerol-3-phosphate cytidylyltransferase [Parashewanella curva]|uniref:Glycerol-3-phosphate cytidylyltransferase n=1 Tax=Parashewanella curva TaxID=2338552 RepID=A0A3L8PYG9_9GAMM|nr:adenylyltransferase/cytidyltransferase family protein [Parashewanella curva]RLV60384.1 glycerol-3-phosphate cytidylyltransferase [Parashewanella curva]